MTMTLAKKSPPGRRARRGGTIVPAMALCLTGLFGFMALAIDLGLLAVARTQCQNSADAAALVSTRNLDNKPTSTDSNRPNANTAANQTVQGNVLLAANFQAGDIYSVRYGVYDYNTSTLQFNVTYPSAPPAGRSWTATEVVVTGSHGRFFSKLIGTAALATNARAVAVHRPRDVAVIMDLTGSMRYGSTLNANGVYISADPVYPAMAHNQRYTTYTANNPNAGSNGSAGSRTNPFFTTQGFVAGSGELYAPTNYTVPTAGGPPSVKDFYFDRGNVTSPSNTALSINPNMAAVDPNTPLPRAFHHYDPGVANAGNPDAYIAPTYDYSGWAGVYDKANFVQYPFPADFADQSNPAYVGDLFPRKKGRENTVPATTSWDPLTTNGAAVNAAEYLGWIPEITSGSGTPNPNGTTPALPTTAPGRTWANFRDSIWEYYGYDLDVTKYIAHRNDFGPYDPGTPVTPTVQSYVETVYSGVKPAAKRFKGYSMGPGYWGKTFWMWPADPRWGNPDGTGTADPTSPSSSNPVQDTSGKWICDWRRRFFLKSDGTPFDPQTDNMPATSGTGNFDGIDEALLRNGTGNTLGSYNANAKPNYAAILKWIKQPPLALPTNLRSGRVLYYSSIPDDVNTGSGSSDQVADKAFWKNYIDFVLNGNSVTDFEYNAWPEGATLGVFAGDLTQYARTPTADPRPYMNYLDNPSRPRAQFWFGPISMMGFLANARGNSWSGTTHESQTWQLKSGMNSALDDIRNNHPNDSVGMAYFSYGGYGTISVPVGQEWNVLKSALFYPQSMINNGRVFDPKQETRAFDGNNNYLGYNDIPNAQGSTDPNTGLVMAYNMLSPSASVPLPPLPPAPWANQTAPRRGRRGASKIVIFETDGVPNSYCTASFNQAGYNSYYTITDSTGGSPGNGASAAMQPAYDVVDQIVKPMASGTSGDSGLSGGNSPARVYAIGFGDLFSTPSATFQPQARAFLLNLQIHGKTSAAGDPGIPPAQIITGGYQTRIDSLKTCLQQIMQGGVAVTLVE